MRSSPEVSRQRFAAARVARLATVSAVGDPHLVPVTFALVGPTDQDADSGSHSATELIVFAVDHKPKSTTALRRLDNIAANPRVAFLVDCYDDDWAWLWWVRADAVSALLDGAARRNAISALQAKYAQYRDVPPGGIVVGSEVTRWSGWQAGG
ncbi:MAG: TIGR03668 family PPOX class F420-dependent oxidoreductase [Nakamurella sp.]